MSMTEKEALIAYGEAEVTLARAKETGDAQTITRANTLRAEAQAERIKAKATRAEKPDDSKAALKKENAELKAKVAHLVNRVQEESDRYWAAMNKIKELEWALREAKGEQTQNFGAQNAVIASPTKYYPKLSADDLLQD